MTARRNSRLDPSGLNTQPSTTASSSSIPGAETEVCASPASVSKGDVGRTPHPSRETRSVRAKALVPGACARCAGRRPGKDEARALHVTRPTEATHRTRLSRGLSPAPSPAEAGAGASLWRVTRRSWSHNYERLSFCC